MHKGLKMALVAGLVCICPSLYAVEENYLGVSYKYRSMRGHSYDMRLITPDYYKGGEVFYAHRFASDIGVHVGYEQSQQAKYTHVYITGQQFLGVPQSPGAVSVTQTTIKALQLNMVGYLEIFKKIELIGQFGISLMRAELSGTVTSAGIVHNMLPGNDIRVIPTVSFGMQYFLFGSMFGIRLLGDWEATNLYRLNITDLDGVGATINPYKQSWCVTAGVVVRF